MDADDGIDEECQLEAVYYGRREGGAGRATDGQAGEGRERTIRKKSPPYISFLWGSKGFLGRLSAAGRLVASGRAGGANLSCSGFLCLPCILLF